MTALESISLLLSERNPGAYRVASDLAHERGWSLEEVSDDEAEYDRVRSAVGPEAVVLDEKGRPVRCGGLRAVHPDVGGRFKQWMQRRVARLWVWRSAEGKQRRWEAMEAPLRLSARERREARQMEAAWS